MSEVFEKRISGLEDAATPPCLAGGRKGIEKESLRVTADGALALTPHPAGLGSALTNQFITTDFSEALLEFVTPAYSNTWEALQSLCDIHQFVYSQLGDEMLWPSSMPCAMLPDKEIPLALYGDSNVGKMKTIYRNGLSYRYGRTMQTIAGIHFNYSVPTSFWPVYQGLEGDTGDLDDFRSAAYFGLVRNFRRFGWLVLYLFGSSPALCKSFLRDNDIGLPSFNENTFYQPYATSLRMSDLGYNSSTQASIKISLNTLDDYVRDLSAAISTPEPEYEKIGVKVDGEYRQLNVNKLQIENEFYSPVRPKRVAESGERPTTALQRGGVEYVEIRSLDINLFDPVGISQNTMRFMEAFLVYCLLEESPPFDDAAFAEAARNHSRAATEGRDPEFKLRRDGREVRLQDWAREILEHVERIARMIDCACDRADYVPAVQTQQELLDNPDATPSARILKDMRDADIGFFHYALQAANNHRDYFAGLPNPTDERMEALAKEAAESLERQAEIEAADSISLDKYLEQWFAA